MSSHARLTRDQGLLCRYKLAMIIGGNRAGSSVSGDRSSRWASMLCGWQPGVMKSLRCPYELVSGKRLLFAAQVWRLQLCASGQPMAKIERLVLVSYWPLVNLSLQACTGPQHPRVDPRDTHRLRQVAAICERTVRNLQVRRFNYSPSSTPKLEHLASRLVGS